MPSSSFDYNRARNVSRVVLDVFNRSTVAAARSTIDQFGQQFRDDLVERIESQRFRHAPLSPGYVEAKRRAGLDPRILIATHEYLDSIEVSPLTDGSGVRVGVGGRTHSGGIPMRQLARMLEFGTIRMPARPHWRPLASIYKRRARQMARELGANISRSVNDAMRRRS